MVFFYIENSRPDNTTNDNDSNLRELEQLVDQLQTVNRTLSSMYFDFYINYDMIRIE